MKGCLCLCLLLQGKEVIISYWTLSKLCILKEQVDVAMKSNILNSRVSKEQSAEIAKEKVSFPLNLSQILYGSSSMSILFYCFVIL